LRFPGKQLADGQSPGHLGGQVLPHRVARRLVEPVQEPATGRGLAQSLIDLEAHAGKELLDFADRFQPLSLPAAVAEGARRLDKSVRRRG
jgi:hypothetical protein